MVHTSPTSDVERGKESVIDFKASEGALYIWVSRAGPLSLEFNHFNVRRCPGTCRRELGSKGGPTTEMFFSSCCVYLCLYEVLEAWAPLLRGRALFVSQDTGGWPGRHTPSPWRPPEDPSAKLLSNFKPSLGGRVLLVLPNPSLNPTTGSGVARRTAEERLTGALSGGGGVNPPVYHQKGGAG